MKDGMAFEVETNHAVSLTFLRDSQRGDPCVVRQDTDAAEGFVHKLTAAFFPLPNRQQVPWNAAAFSVVHFVTDVLLV
jgi:hypothetical protein